MNEYKQVLIGELKKKGSFWLAVARDLEMPARNSRTVNISRIARHTHENDVIVVSGKVLGSGILTHPVIIGAFAFSEGAKSRIERANGKCISIAELAAKYPDGKKIRVIG